VTCGIDVGGDVLFMLDFIGEKKICNFLRHYMREKGSNPYPLDTPLSVVPSDETKNWLNTPLGREWHDRYYIPPNGVYTNFDPDFDIHDELDTVEVVDSDAETVYLGLDEE
jgi:hypothetical protein